MQCWNDRNQIPIWLFEVLEAKTEIPLCVWGFNLTYPLKYCIYLLLYLFLGSIDLKICSKTEVETVGSRFQSKIKDRLGRIHPQYTQYTHFIYCFAVFNQKTGELNIWTLTLFLTIWHKGLKKSASKFNLMCTATQQQGTYFVKVFYNYEFTVQ